MKALKNPINAPLHKFRSQLVNNVGASEQARAFYKSLATGSRLRKEIDQAVELLKSNALIGNRIEKKKFPKEYMKKYGINNLYRYKLGEGYRLLYTILTEGSEITCSVLDVMDHTEYEKLFGYD